MADVRTIHFLNTIKEKLFAGAEFVKTAVSHDGFVNNKTVEIPQAGAIPAVQEDRSSLPATISQRTDDKQTYNLIEFTTDPILVKSKDKSELSYDVVSSILKQHMDKLNDRIALRALYNWAGAGLLSASGQIIETTGTDTANIAPPSGTGNRKGLTLLDVAEAAKKLDKDNVSDQNRYMVIPPDMYWNFVETYKAQLLNLDYNKNLTNGDIANGVVAKVYGFNMIKRSYTTVFDNETTPVKKAVGAAAAATDNWAAIGFQADEVCRALGSIDVFSELGKPDYYGDVYSALVRFNAEQMRTDGTGIVTVVQAQ